MNIKKNYIPALKFHYLTPLYDWAVKWTSKETIFKGKLIEQATLNLNETVLDVGCGTGTLLNMLCAVNENLNLYGIDIDLKSIQIAEKKAKNLGSKLKIKQGLSTALPFANQYFDTVFCSLMFHHLADEQKVTTLQEIYRVLKPGGQLHFADWGKPSNKWLRYRFLIVQLFDGFATTNACLTDLVELKMKEIGFIVLETARVKALVGEIVLLRANKV